MRKKREFVQGLYYHVTSRTNAKVRVFENNKGLRIMLNVLHEAKDKYHFRLANYCVMPTHIHLMIKTKKGGSSLSDIMCWIKTQSAKRWNSTEGSGDHLWGHRFFARPINNYAEFKSVMDYIDLNPVKSGYVQKPADWIGSYRYKVPGTVC